MHLGKMLKESVKNVQRQIKNDRNILQRDKFVVRVSAGNGGPGLPRFDGVGGNGGHVVFIPFPNISFPEIPQHFGSSMQVRAPSGMGATKIKLVGQNAEHLIVGVPVGVEVVNDESGILLARCEKPFYRYLVARGGQGANRMNSFRPEKGEAARLSIHVKLRPNVALLGFPNAGKSTIMKVGLLAFVLRFCILCIFVYFKIYALVPNKSVKIASYAFTTQNPQMCFWNGGESRKNEDEEAPFTLSIADLPGLIEGASRNRGRGCSFLKHLEYADSIVLVVDCNGFQLKNDLNEPYRSALECVALLNREVEDYDEKILQKPVVIALNKVDTITDQKWLADLVSVLESPNCYSALPSSMQPRRPFRILHVVPTSAKTGDVSKLVWKLRSMKEFISDRNRLDG